MANRHSGVAKDLALNAMSETRFGEWSHQVTTQIFFVTEIRLNLNSVNQLIFVMVKCGVLFEVRPEFLNNI
jgi:hypothetical protein